MLRPDSHVETELDMNCTSKLRRSLALFDQLKSEAPVLLSVISDKTQFKFTFQLRATVMSDRRLFGDPNPGISSVGALAFGTQVLGRKGIGKHPAQKLASCG